MFQENKMDNAKYNGQNVDAQMIEHSKARWSHYQIFLHVVQLAINSIY